MLDGGSDSYYFPPLTEVLTTFKDTWLFERVGSDVVPSLVRMGAGFAIAVVVGVALGHGARPLAPRARRAAAPIVEFLRAIPPPALLPFAILVIGVGASMKIFIIAFVCVWPILLNTIDGAAGIDPTLERHHPRLRDRQARPPAARGAARRGPADLRRHAHRASRWR